MQIIGEFVFLVMVDVAAHYICKWLDQDKKDSKAYPLIDRNVKKRPQPASCGLLVYFCKS